MAPRFAEQVKGANAGDTRVVDIELSTAAADADLRGKTVKATFEIKDVKTLRLPELTHEFLHTFGVHSAGRAARAGRRRAAAPAGVHAAAVGPRAGAGAHRRRRDVGAAAGPADAARRARRWPAASWKCAADGIAEEEIAQRQRLLQQDVLRSTELALKEHFVLQKIAEDEKIEITDDDLADSVRL